MQNKNIQFPCSFGRYVLTRKIATGGMAEIYEAKIVGTQSFEKKIVIKKLIDRYEQEKKFIDLFIDEARITAKLNHFNIAQVYDFGMCDNSYYIAMEYVDGIDVCEFSRNYINKKGLLPLSWVLYILSSMAKALHYTHTFKVDKEHDHHIELVHRDVSPQNILINTQGIVKLIDFGVAKSNINLHKTEPGTIRGKYIYMSPEQINQKPIDLRTDIYALGIVAYELLTGSNPFYDKSSSLKNLLLDVSKAKKRSILEIKPDLDLNVAQMIERMTARNPLKRFQSLSPVIKVITKIADELNISFEQVQEEITQAIIHYCESEKDNTTSANKIFTHNDISVSKTLDDSHILVLDKVTGIKTKANVKPRSISETEPDSLSTRIKKNKALQIAFAIGLYCSIPLIAYMGFVDHEQISNTINKVSKNPQAQLPAEDLLLKKVNHVSVTVTENKNPPVAKQQIQKKQTSVPAKPISKECPSDMKKIMHQNQSYCMDIYEYPNLFGKIPVRAKQWQEARDICKSISKDLCTTNQWLWACKNTDKKTMYPYGNAAKKTMCNISFSSNIRQDPMPSGTFDACKSDDLIYDLSGNLSEWVIDKPGQAVQAVLGGSSWQTIADTQCESAKHLHTTAQEPDVGFRCCKSI